ncbi:MAG: hypothetical protein ACHBNF_15760, partial [Chromatiales bacterium]
MLSRIKAAASRVSGRRRRASRRFAIWGMVDVMIYVELVGMLLVILMAAEIFTNALEHLGEKLKISEGVTGSLFAAVGTAMPESMVPILAI